MECLEKIWSNILHETKLAQETIGENKGLVRNFVIDDYYLRETAFAAKIFATEFVRSGELEYKERANLCIEVLNKKIENFGSEGIDEPIVTPRGIDKRKGSIPATILLLESLFEAAEILGRKDIAIQPSSVIEYIESCYLGAGRFYHDTIEERNKIWPHVVNTTSMAYYYLEKYGKKTGSKFYENEIEKVRWALEKSIRSDGFSPYIEPAFWQKIVFMFYKLGLVSNFPLKVYNHLLGDRSIFFGDAVHHLITFFYYAKGCLYSGRGAFSHERQIIENGWAFVKNKLVVYEESHLKFDFSWEPLPRHYRHCNFIDTTTYFYILAFLKYLLAFGIITREESFHYQTCIGKHILNSLLLNEVPCVNPYEGGKAIVDMIMPRPSESVFNKGALLAEVFL